MATGKTVFITGAARGIGRACAQRFAAAGWFVGLTDVDGEALASAAEVLAARHGADRSCHSQLDVTQTRSIADAIAHFAARTGGRMDALINNAGIMHVGRFESQALADLRRLLAVNVQGVIEVAHGGFALLRATPGSRLINLSSASAIYGVPEMAVYSASKHAVRGLTEALDAEWAGHDIRVCDVMPMFVRTDLLTNTKAARSQDVLGVRLQPEDVAAVVYAAATSSRPKVHWPVGLQSKLAYYASGVAPSSLERLVMRLMSRL